MTQDIESINQEWRAAWDDADIINLQQTLAHNVHLNELPPAEDISLSDRDLNTARRARQELYTEGARLYRLYDDLLNNRFHREAVQELLRETIITPTRDYRIFELFCIFAVINRLQDIYPVKLRRIHSDTDEIAILEGPEETISIYYDEGGPLDFYEEYPRSDQLESDEIPPMMRRQARALEDHDQLITAFLDRGSRHSFYQGRPDFLILRRSKKTDTEGLLDVIIGEVKYTQRPSTFSEGLRELLEYVYFAKENGEFLFDEKLDPENVYGIICTDGVETSADQEQQIHHWSTSSLMADFENSRACHRINHRVLSFVRPGLCPRS